MMTTMRRWVIFNWVGVLGFLVQIAALNGFIRFLGMGHRMATILAVQIAVIHNFCWHQRWTWADRRGTGRAPVWRRFLMFNLTNGLFSVVGNVAFMELFLAVAPIDYTAANILAVAACSIVNYGLSDRLVFGIVPLDAKTLRD
jgi:putative flippase GtrA